MPEYDDGTADSPSWLDTLKKSVGGMFESPPRKPVLDADRWNRVLDTSMSPEEAKAPKALIEAIAGHVNEAPRPNMPTSFGGQLGAAALGGISAAFLRGAGASPIDAAGVPLETVKNWRDKELEARQQGWTQGGNLVIPQVQQALQNAQQQKLAKEAMARQRARFYGEAPPAATTSTSPAGAPTATGAAPGVSSPPGPGAAPAGSPGAPGPTPGPADAMRAPGGPDIAASVANGARPGHDPDAPQYPLAPGSTIRFHMPESVHNTRALLEAAMEEHAALVGQNKLKSTGDTNKDLEQLANTPGSVLAKALADDHAKWQASTPFKVRQASALKEAEGVAAYNQEQLKSYQSAGRAANNNNNVISMMKEARQAAASSGQLGIGPGNTILGPIHGILERIGGPHLKQGGVAMINELQQRAGVEASNEEVNSPRGPGQRVMIAFLKAVPGAEMTESGFDAAAAGIEAINTYHVASARIAEQIMSEPGSHASVRNLQSEVARRAQPYFDEAVKKAQAAIDAGVQSKQTAASPEKLAAAKSIYDKATPAQQAEMEKSWSDAGHDPAQLKASGAPAGTASATLPAGGGVHEALGIQAAPQRPAQGGFKQKLWDWSYPEQRRKWEQEMERIKKTGMGAPAGYY